VAVSLLTEIMHEAGTPPGVFNLLNGEGNVVGAALSSHPDVDMVAITGSLEAGRAVARAAADTVKRVQQELGGKGPNIILEDADLEAAVRGGVASCFFFSGQTCGAPSRMIVPERLVDRVIEIARDAAEKIRVGPPLEPGVDFGPVISRAQFDKVQRLIRIASEEGARLVAGGSGAPDGLDGGWYCRPTVFAGVQPSMTIAREEVFGPVLSILTYRDEEEAIEMANDSAYGLVGYVQSADIERAAAVASRIRCGYISVNYPPLNISVPHGGYRRSGNGRQWGAYGLAEYLELTAVVTPPTHKEAP
jgi:acyl-CoA reductase-like NAD-dependent aldehyde dehydrogenase